MHRAPVLSRFAPLTLAAALLLCGGARPADADEADELAKVEIKVHKVSGSVYMLEGEGGNIGVSVGDDGIVIVDDQFAPLVPKIQAALRGITDKPLRFILNTHYHGDHTGGNALLGQNPGVSIIAHDNVRRRLAEGRKGKRDRPPAPKAALPIVTFNDTATVHVNGETIRAIHLPSGHTDGDSAIYFVNAKVVHMGDDFVTYGYPFIDLEAGGSVQGLIANLDRIMQLLPADVKIIPGHGAVSTMAEVKHFQGMLKQAVALVEAGIRAGKPLAALKKAHLLAPLEAEWGKGFVTGDEFVETLYQDLTRKH